MKPFSLAIPRPDNLPSDKGAVMQAPPEPAEPRYPTAYIDEYRGPELASEGLITFRFRLKEKTERTNPDGTETCSLALDLREVVEADLEDEESEIDPDETAAEAMDSKLKYRR